MTKPLDDPLVFIINFGCKRGGVSNPDLDAFAAKAGAQWVYLGAAFTHENPHAHQVRHSLQALFDSILEYAETGIPPGG